MTESPKPLWPLGLLGLTLLSLWSVWAFLLWPSWGKVPGAGWISRAVAWGIPCGVYLYLTWKERWWFPLGLTFPLGRAQVVRSLVVFCLVAAASVMASSRSHGVPPGEWLSLLFRHAEPRWSAPVFEELVFRGVVLSELLTWTHENSESPLGRRLRFWLSQCAAASLFVALHLPHWLSHGGWDWAATHSLPLFAFALVMGFVFAHTRSIWPCIGLHYLNNEVSLLPLP